MKKYESSIQPKIYLLENTDHYIINMNLTKNLLQIKLYILNTSYLK